ncbi:hypothetical protein C8Q77DRAFT_698244 [Trametes polyzona]|nr:hypothetical protein C8Q77DRAFT_698244 [Trametes polyzona]
MKFSTAALSASLAALAGTAVAQLEIVVPGGPDLWWIAQSDNVLAWTCKTSPYTNFTVLLANSDPKILVSPQAFYSQQNNFDCSKLVTKDQINMTPATGYTVQLANPFNNTDVYAESKPFEIKAIGSSYPASSATPSNLVSATGAGSSGTATASGASATTTGTGNTTTQDSGKPNGAGVLSAPNGLAAVALAALGYMFA